MLSDDDPSTAIAALKAQRYDDEEDEEDDEFEDLEAQERELDAITRKELAEKIKKMKDKIRRV